MTDSDAGEEKYRQQLWGYDATGHVTRSVGPAQEARFSWDAAGNRTEAPGQRVWHNLLQRLNGIRLAYDGFGRLAERRDTRHGVTQRFRWDEENRLSDVELEGHREYRRATYRYDLLGRRTHKLLYRHGRAEPEVITFEWNGLRLAGEAGSGAPGKKTQYVYSEGSWEPLARVDSSAAGSEVYWYHTALNGLPERMTDAQGETVWQGTFSTWGETQREQSHAPLAVAQNLRFQGQYLDRETGLHYNLFRYYDPATGRYTQPDPIGLAGGLNTYAYAPNPLTWADPLGLSPCSPMVKPINGRNPINSSYAGKIYPASALPVEIRGKYPHGVPFNHAGFPDFSKYSIKNVRIELGKSRTIDFGRADKAAGYSRSNPRPDGYTWHHHQDSGYMQLVPTDIHSAVKHTGGVATGK